MCWLSRNRDPPRPESLIASMRLLSFFLIMFCSCSLIFLLFADAALSVCVLCVSCHHFCTRSSVFLLFYNVFVYSVRAYSQCWGFVEFVPNVVLSLGLRSLLNGSYTNIVIATVPFMPLPPLEQCWRHYVFRLSIRLCVCPCEHNFL